MTPIEILQDLATQAMQMCATGVVIAALSYVIVRYGILRGRP
jgi:hypothetical protein